MARKSRKKYPQGSPRDRKSIPPRASEPIGTNLGVLLQDAGLVAGGSR